MCELIKDYTIKKGHELRIEVSFKKSICLNLMYGEADIFGSILNLDRNYIIKGKNIAVFAFDDSKIRIKGKPEILYYSGETMMLKYLKIYEIIEEKMASAKKLKQCGPRVLFAGPNDSGKSTLIKILTNFSVRMGWQPTLVDLDIDQGFLTVPGFSL